jgi:transcription elongation GreA/GreB family factor
MFQIVGEDEADPSKGSISHASPLARSMFGKSLGGVVLETATGKPKVSAKFLPPPRTCNSLNGEGHDA